MTRLFKTLCLIVILGCTERSAAQTPGSLWSIGTVDGKADEFALAPGDYTKFLQFFGSPDRAYYIGLSQPRTDWPYVLPGLVDQWAGGGADGRWDQMNTLPVGFVLESAPAGGTCTLVIDVADTHPKRPTALRITVNGGPFNMETAAGGSEQSIDGNLASARKQVVRIEFPAALLRTGYNEISLRGMTGSWLLFDALHLETPAGARLAPVTATIVRSVTAAPYAVSSDPGKPATLRLEVYRSGGPGSVVLRLGGGKPQNVPLASGLQVLEIPAPASRTQVHLSDGAAVLYQADLELVASPPVTPADYVNVFSGTAHSRWMIAPGPWMPFSMVKIAPDNQTQGWVAGYDYPNEHIDSFSHIHEWTMAGLGMMPTTGPLRTQPGFGLWGYSSVIDKASERGGIGYYDVFLKDHGVRVELTATTRASLQRYTFPASDEARVLFDFLLPNEYEMHILSAKVRRAGPTEIEGTIATEFPALHYNGNQRFDLHFVAQFDRPFDRMGGWEYEQVFRDVQELNLNRNSGIFVEFTTKEGEKIQVRTGISLVSTRNARLNLETELSGPFGWDFEAVVSNQRSVWNELFGRVQVETPDAREKTRFYTNMYRAFVGRNIWSDVNGEWMDPEERVQRLEDPDAVMLGCDAFWNTFWNLNQVMNLLAPEWSKRWVDSELNLYDKTGWLSKGPAGLEYISVMVAEHEIPLLVAAYQHGIKGIDGARVLDAAVKMQTTLPQKHPGGGWVGNEHLENYLKHGYVAIDGPLVGQGTTSEWDRTMVSNTLEYAYDDWTVEQLARALRRTDVAATFAQRAQNWRNVIDTETGFARPRRADGTWVSPFDPFHTPGFVEGNAWQYTWFVPHDVAGLVDALGRDRFVSRLNEAFERSAPTRFNAAGERAELFPINHGNQPSMQAAWLFNWAGEPWRTQQWVRGILDAYYGYRPADAYLGDEDQGQMSAWFVMAALGLFQTDGGARVDPIYEIGSPLYPKATIHFSPEHYGGRTFTIETRNASRENRYVQSATLNGKPLEQWWLAQKDLLKGGRLILEMGPSPNTSWATGPAAFPPR